MSLLLGDCTNPEFNASFKDHALNALKTRSNYEWMQAYANDWNPVLATLFSGSLIKAADNNNTAVGPVIELNTRINFRFNQAQFLSNQPVGPAADAKIKIIRNEQDIYRRMNGSVVPAHFWDSEEDFNCHGIGFSLYDDGKLAATAFSSFRSGDQLELGIESLGEYRGKGLARVICTALINYCLENNLEPVWACRLENTGSYKLALKLGFEPVLQLPYYRLSD
jgi:GNAT superfamily N-acetyltransferase